MNKNMTSKAQEAVIAYPLLNAHFLSSFLHAEYRSGLFISKTVDGDDCLGVLVLLDEEVRRHVNFFCDGEAGGVEGDGLE